MQDNTQPNQNNDTVAGATSPGVPVQAQSTAPSQGQAEPLAQPQQQNAWQQPAPTAPTQPVQSFEQATAPMQAQSMESTVPPSNFSTTPAVPPKQNSKKKLLVVAVAIVAVLLAGAAAYYYGVYQKPENVLLDSFSKLTVAKATQADAVITINKNISPDATFKNVTIKSATANEAGLLDATINLEYKGKAVKLGGKAIAALKDNTFYFQVNNLKQALMDIIEADGDTDQVPAGYFDVIDTIQGQWVKVSADDIKKTNQAAGNDFECTTNVVKKYSTDAASKKEWQNLYVKNPFVVVKESLGVKNNLMGYKLSWDYAKAKEFSKSIADTQFAKDIKACDQNNDSSQDSSDSVDAATTDNTVFTVWVDQWSHELKKVEVTGGSGTGSDKLAFNGNVDVTYDTNVKVDMPTSTISLQEFVKRYQEVALKMGMPDSETLEEQFIPGDSVSNSI